MPYYTSLIGRTGWRVVTRFVCLDLQCHSRILAVRLFRCLIVNLRLRVQGLTQTFTSRGVSIKGNAKYVPRFIQFAQRAHRAAKAALSLSALLRMPTL